MKTKALLEKAVNSGRTLADLSRAVGVNSNALSKAKAEGRLSPGLAFAVAQEIGENPTEWAIVAIQESERSAPLRRRLNAILAAGKH